MIPDPQQKGRCSMKLKYSFMVMLLMIVMMVMVASVFAIEEADLMAQREKHIKGADVVANRINADRALLERLRGAIFTIDELVNAAEAKKVAAAEMAKKAEKLPVFSKDDAGTKDEIAVVPTTDEGEINLEKSVDTVE